MQLVRRFVCGRCGAVAAIADLPYMHCRSCGAVGDYDWSTAARHPAWHAHQEMAQQRLSAFGARLEAAVAARDVAGYAATYAELLDPVIVRFPPMFPKRTATEPEYRARFASFIGGWQATNALSSQIVDGNSLIAYTRQRVVLKGKRCDAKTLWPFVDVARQTIETHTEFVRAEQPEDFAPHYVRRFGIVTLVTEWLPVLGLPDQKELVKRFGVEREYVAPATDGHVACPNCAAPVQVRPNFDVMPCPYCGAEIRETRAAYEDVEKNRRARAVAYSEIAGYLEGAEARGHGKLVAIEVLDGEVTRDGESRRIVLLSACFPKRKEAFWEAQDKLPGARLDGLLAWAADATAARAAQLVKLPYREHPRCATLPANGSELEQRLRDVAPSAQPGDVVITVDGKGFDYDVVVDGTAVRLLVDEAGKCNMMLRGWRAR
jgi:hypothetical protein